MSAAAVAQIVVYVAVLTALTPLVGGYMARVHAGRPLLLGRVLGPLERGLYRTMGVAADRDQDWKAYGRAVLVFSAVCWLALFAILESQRLHPWNPAGLGAPPWDLAFNTASSFVTNTNWQYYAGETTMTAFSQMAGLAVQNFVSAAVGIAVVVAVIRGLAARSATSLGNFWVDLVRTVLYVLAPLAAAGALFLVSRGVVQTLASTVTAHPLAGGAQTIAVGPVASQEAIKELGTNGGGYFNVNSAHPFENPDGLSNFAEMLGILLIPAGLTATFGRMVGDRRQGWAVFAAMISLFVAAIVAVSLAEAHGSPAQQLAGIAGGNLEGKETRFGVGSCSLFAVVTTVASSGAVNAAMESLTGLGGAVPMANMMTGEVVFGGVGSGLYGMLLFALLAVFLAGLMVGRTPEYLGKKIEAREIKLVSIGTLAVPIVVLLTTALAIGTRDGRASIAATGPQGFSETLYAYTSQANNNGSAFAGYSGTTFADLLGGLAMLGGRFLPMLAVLAVAGSLAGKRVAPAGPGTFRTDTPTFVVLLTATVVLLALLTFVPALLLGPVVQGLSDRMF